MDDLVARDVCFCVPRCLSYPHGYWASLLEVSKSQLLPLQIASELGSAPASIFCVLSVQTYNTHTVYSHLHCCAGCQALKSSSKLDMMEGAKTAYRASALRSAGVRLLGLSCHHYRPDRLNVWPAGKNQGLCVVELVFECFFQTGMLRLQCGRQPCIG